MTDTMDRKKKIIVSIIATILLILTLLGITYAYFLTRIKGNTNDKSIKIKTANLKLLFEKAKDYEKASFKGLYNFINYIDKISKGSDDMGSAKLIRRK